MTITDENANANAQKESGKQSVRRSEEPIDLFNPDLINIDVSFISLSHFIKDWRKVLGPEISSE